MPETRRDYLKLISGTIATSSAALAGCSGNGGGEATPEPTETPSSTPMSTQTPTSEDTATPIPCEEGGETHEVLMGGSGHGPFFFDPIGLFINPGDTVKWVNDTSGHSATAYHESLDSSDVTRIPEEAEPFNSGTMNNEGAVYTYTFEVPGTYDYFCIPHKGLGMIGRLVVCRPGGPAVGSNPPIGELPSSQRIMEEKKISYDEWAG